MAERCPDEPGSSPLKLQLPKKKRRLSTEWDTCIICQNSSKEKVSKAGSTGLEALKSSSQIRNDEIGQCLESRKGGTDMSIFYHRSCYQSYTSKRNLSFFSEHASQEKPKIVEPKHTRANTHKMTDWSTCFICHSRKRDKLHRVRTGPRQATVRKAAEARDDQDMLGLLEGEDLFAKNAIYHSTCMASYISTHNMSSGQYQQDVPQSDEHQNAFSHLVDEIDTDLRGGKAFKMKNLLHRFKTILGDNEETSYTTQKLQRQLKHHYGDAIVVHSQRGQSKSSIIMSSHVSLGDAVRAFAQLKEDFSQSQMETDAMLPEDDNQLDSSKSALHKVVGDSRDEISQMMATTEYPTPGDINMDSSENALPAMLKTFFVWLISKEAFDTADETYLLNENKRRKVLSLVETTIHCV